MEVIIQKFGGTSLADEQSRAHVLRHIICAQQTGKHIVVIVSAMGRKGNPYATDTLLQLVQNNGDFLLPREKDLLLSCGELISATVLCSELRQKGLATLVLTGTQAGILTDERFGNAKIQRVDPKRIQNHLKNNEIVIVTGFQGGTDTGELTTLGRGGSDTTAVALGVALNASVVDIYTDVEGILTADPKWVHDAQPLPAVSYDEVFNMAYNGAKVIHPQAIDLAKASSIALRIRSTFSDGEGTLISHSRTLLNQGLGQLKTVTGLAHVREVTQFVLKTTDQPTDMPMRVFRKLADKGISIDFFNVMPTEVYYTVSSEKTSFVLDLLQKLGLNPKIRKDCSKVAVIGAGMNGVPGVLAKIVEELTKEKIPILQSADSNITIWLLIPECYLANALQVLHQAFDLHLGSNSTSKGE